jgi:hypothetical protein
VTVEKEDLLEYVLSACVALVIAFSLYLANPYWTAMIPLGLGSPYYTLRDTLFVEGLVFLCYGVTFVAVAKYKQETYTERRLGAYRRHLYRWTLTTHGPHGWPFWLFPVGLTLTFTGVILIVLVYI